jgi:hypothetical protein
MHALRAIAASNQNVPLANQLDEHSIEMSMLEAG